MANWCEGKLKVTGKQEDIKRFMMNGLEPVDYFGYTREPLKIDRVGCIQDLRCWIKGTDRGFLNNINVIFDGNDNQVVTYDFDAEFAYSASPEELLEIAREYNLGIEFHGIEECAQYQQDIVIADGKIVKNFGITLDEM